MPYRASQRPTDLERAARVLGARRPRHVGVGERDDDLGVVAEPELDPLFGPREGPEGAGESTADGGWVPQPPGAASRPSGLSGASRASLSATGAAVRRLRARATDDEVSRLDADLRRARRPALLTVPDELRSGRRAVSSAALVSLLALVVAVGCAFVLRVLWAERSSSGSEVAPGPTRSVQVVGGPDRAAAPSYSTGATPTGAPSVPGAAATPTASAEIVVHVVGQVLRPGLVRLRAGSRVADAIRQAGGARAGADVAALNLARPLVDGEQIRVPRPGETVTAAPGAGAGSSGQPAAGASGSGGSDAGVPVSLNTADAAALDSLPGVGPVLAQRIIDWRTEHGRFTSVDELGEVSGIGDKLLERLRAKVVL